MNFQISYKGPLGGQANYKRLKEDLPDFSLICYPLEEVLIEKMCALMGRTEPRDLYDLWYLLEIAKLESIYHWPEFIQKAQHKGHNPNHFTGRLEQKLLNFKARWETSLSAQIHSLPPFNQVIRELDKHLRKFKSLEVD